MQPFIKHSVQNKDREATVIAIPHYGDVDVARLTSAIREGRGKWWERDQRVVADNSQ
jgi:hypothetical protein